MIRAIALDDEPPALRVLSHFCQQVDFIDLQHTFTRTDEALVHLTQSETNLLFLDVNMPFMSGVDFYKSITAAGTVAPMVIFTTAHAQYAVEGFTLNAVDYLLKPFTFDRFLQAVTKARDLLHWQQRSGPVADSLYIRADYTIYKIALTDILFIEGLDDYLKIHLTTSNRPIVARMTMKAILEKLPGVDTSGVDASGVDTSGVDTSGVDASDRDDRTMDGSEYPFIRVHRSFIVPLNRIEGIRNKVIRLAGREIPVGASYETALLKRFRP